MPVPKIPIVRAVLKGDRHVEPNLPRAPSKATVAEDHWILLSAGQIGAAARVLLRVGQVDRVERRRVDFRCLLH